MDTVLEKAYHACLKGQGCAFATIVENTLYGTARKAGAKMAVFKDGSIVGTIGGGLYEKAAIKECLKAIKLRQPKLLTYENFGKKGQAICGGKFSVFIEPFAASHQLIICGGGHIGLALSLIAKLLNFKVTVIDNRKEFASRKRFSHVDHVILGHPGQKLMKIPMDENCTIVIVTHNHVLDLSCLKSAIKVKSTYIGVIGSQNKRGIFLKAIAPALKRDPSILKRIRMPTGIDIGAQTPEEIAVSISAEIISLYNKDWLKSNKFIVNR